MNELFLNAVNMSISASWLILAVLIFRLVFRKAPKWVSVLLWGIVAARLLFPFSVESALSLIPSAETVSPEIMTDAAPTINTGIPAVNNAVNPVIGQIFAPSPETNANPLQIWVPVFAAAWAAGAAVLLAYTAASYWRLRRRVDTAVLFRDNIFRSENAGSPFVLGIVRPRIYLPFSLDGQDIRHVVAHEQAHIERRDHWWKPLGFLLLTVYWFNPLMWLAYALLCRDIEFACDEKVVRELSREQRADYTQALLNCSVSRRRLAACPLAFGEAGVKERVKSVMNYRKPAFWIVVLAVAACAAVAVCFLTVPKKDPPAGPKKDPAAALGQDTTDELPPLYPHRYSVAEVSYERSIYDFYVVAGQNTPVYAVTEGMRLMSKLEYTPLEEWTDLGLLTKTELTKENFDDLFLDPDQWFTGKTAASVRKNNANVWTLVYRQDILYYVLQQKNGEIYLAFGYCDDSEKNNTHIRWLFKLAADLNDGIPEASGGPGAMQTQPVQSVPPVGETEPDTPMEAFSINKDLLSELGMSYLQLSEKYGGVLGGYENTWNFGGYGRYAWKIVGSEWDYTVFDDMTTAGGCNWIDGVTPNELFSGVSWPLSFEDLENRYGFIPLGIEDEAGMSGLYWSEFRFPMYDDITYIVGTEEYGVLEADSSGVLSLKVDCREAYPIVFNE